SYDWATSSAGMPGQTEKALDFLDGKRGLSPFSLQPGRTIE
ncbi:hypothetical protein ACVK1X_006016, partial [Pseudomonas sp. PvR086]